jgi:RNA polymerase sigma-70 factor, ECF subfamily
LHVYAILAQPLVGMARVYRRHEHAEGSVDNDPFDEIYRATSRRLLQYAYAMCGDLGMAQEVTQEAYVRAWQRWSQVREYEHLESWLRLVVTRLVTDRWRSLRVRRSVAAQIGIPQPVPPPSEDGVLLAAALRQIPVQQRRAVVMHYLMDLSIADVARETGASIGTVKSWLSRGRASLAEALGVGAQAEKEGNDVR